MLLGADEVTPVDVDELDEAGATVTTGAFVVVGADPVGSVAAETVGAAVAGGGTCVTTGGGAVVVGAFVRGAVVGGAVVGGAVARVVGGGGGSAALGEMPGSAWPPNANASMLPGAGR